MLTIFYKLCYKYLLLRANIIEMGGEIVGMEENDKEGFETSRTDRMGLNF